MFDLLVDIPYADFSGYADTVKCKFSIMSLGATVVTPKPTSLPIPTSAQGGFEEWAVFQSAWWTDAGSLGGSRTFSGGVRRSRNRTSYLSLAIANNRRSALC